MQPLPQLVVERIMSSASGASLLQTSEITALCKLEVFVIQGLETVEGVQYTDICTCRHYTADTPVALQAELAALLVLRATRMQYAQPCGHMGF